jgi:predicted PurR-regulated permease PerM
MTKLLGRHWRLVLVLLCLVVAVWLIYLLRITILPFILGLVLAYALLPVVRWLEARLPVPRDWIQFRRITSIFIVFILVGGLIAAFVYYMVTLVLQVGPQLLENAPYFFAQGTVQIQQWLDGLRQHLPAEIRAEIDKALVDAGVALGNQVRAALMKGVTSVPQTFGLILGLATIPLFLFYALKDAEKLKRSFYAALPAKIADHTRHIAAIVEAVLGNYLRAQLMLGLIVGYFAFLGLLILGIPYAPALALLAGIGEMIPTLGPWLTGAISAIVTLAIAPDKTIWVIAIFLVVQLAENTLLVPRIQGAYLKIHPAVLIVLLVLGAHFAGIWGLLLAAPITATLVEIVKYARDYYRRGKSGYSETED